MKHHRVVAAVLLVIALGGFLSVPADIYAARGIEVRVKLRAQDRVDAPLMGEETLYTKSHALVIGIDAYTGGWPRLSEAVNDARLVGNALKQKGFEVTFKKDLSSDELSKTLKEFYALKGQNPQSRLVLWFAGHGHTINGEGFLVPADAPRPSQEGQFKYKALSMRRFGEFVRLANAKHALAIFDSCFSGTIFESQRSAPPAAISRATTFAVRQFISSGDANQAVSDDGRFRKLFIRALRGEERGDLNGDGYLTGSELGMYLTNRITNLTNSRQTPRSGKLRDEDYDRGDFVFLMASSAATVEKPVPKSRAGQAWLSVKANINGAQVYVDGQRVGTTPLNDKRVSPGSHEIRVAQSGYQPYVRRYDFRAGRARDIEAILDAATPQTGALYVEATPQNARIRIRNISSGFYQGMELKPGRYQVEVSAKGHETHQEWITLGAGKDKTVTIRLTRVVSNKPQETITVNGVAFKMVNVKAGTFMMGSPAGESGRNDDERQHRVTLTRNYWMGETEVSQALWRAVMGNNPSSFSNCGGDCPVEQVSWDDCQAFIRKLNQLVPGGGFRLPTEAEWEYAARAGSTTAFANGGISELKCGNDANLNAMGWYCGNVKKRTHSVAQKQANRWGLYDMHGNVYEWCQDWYGNYPSGSVTDPTGSSSGFSRVNRGGGWRDDARLCRSADRYGLTPGGRVDALGLRLARTF
jgi:formylglycine-generating enzyme required for sulfatase activity